MTEPGRMSPTLRAFEDWLRDLDATIEIRGPTDGWRAVYVERRLALMARDADPRSGLGIDLASRRTGLEAHLRSTTELSNTALGLSIMEAIQAARLGRVPVRGMDDTSPVLQSGWGSAGEGVTLDLALGALKFLIRAPAWLRGTILAGLAIAGLAVIIGSTTTVPAVLPGLGAVLGTILAAILLRRRFRPTLLDSVEFEEGLRAGTRVLGCLWTGIALLGSVLLALGLVVAVAVPRGANSDLLGPAYLVATSLGWIIALMGYRAIRRRLPPPPTTRTAGRVARVLVALAVIVSVGYGAFVVASSGGPRLTQEQVAWCLGPGSGYVDRAVEVLGINRTWDTSSAPVDRNFASACDTAWMAAHR